MRWLRAKLHQLRANPPQPGARLQQLRAEAEAGSPVGYVFVLAVAAAASTAVYLLSLEHDDPFPWVSVLLFFLLALFGPLRATWRRRRAPTDEAERP